MEQQYLVSYLLIPSPASRRRYRQYALFLTGDLATILRQIIPTHRRTGRGRIEAQLRDYHQRKRVSFGRGGHAGVISDIVIRKLPPRDAEVLAKYL